MPGYINGSYNTWEWSSYYSYGYISTDCSIIGWKGLLYELDVTTMTFSQISGPGIDQHVNKLTSFTPDFQYRATGGELQRYHPATKTYVGIDNGLGSSPCEVHQHTSEMLVLCGSEAFSSNTTPVYRFTATLYIKENNTSEYTKLSQS